MKAIEILELIFKEDLRNDTCGVCLGEDVCIVGVRSYFGLPFMTTDIERNVYYFYFYGQLSDDFESFPEADCILYNGVDNNCCCLWKIEN